MLKPCFLQASTIFSLGLDVKLAHEANSNIYLLQINESV